MVLFIFAVPAFFQPHVSFFHTADLYEEEFEVAEVGFDAVEPGECDGLVGHVGGVVEYQGWGVALRVGWDGEWGGDRQDLDVGVFVGELGEELEQRREVS